MPQSDPTQVATGLLLVAIAGLAACGGGRAVNAALGTESPTMRPLPPHPLGEQSPQLLAAWRRSDAEWAKWTDPAAKRVRFIAMPDSPVRAVRLEVLDWGAMDRRWCSWPALANP